MLAITHYPLHHVVSDTSHHVTVSDTPHVTNAQHTAHHVSDSK